MCQGSGTWFQHRQPRAPARPRHVPGADLPRPLAEIRRFQQRMRWTVPWFSSFGTTFNEDLGVTVDGHESFGLSVFLRDGDRVHRTYFTSARGVDRLRMDFTLLDLTPFGRQEEWEDSPEGWPQFPPYVWWRKHEEHGAAVS